MTYVPPRVRESLSCPVDIGADDARMHWRQDVYRGKVVDFCIQIEVRPDASADWECAFRVDSSDGQIHHHQMYASGRSERRTLISVIPDRGWEHVDQAWNEWLERMLNEWESYHRRWRDA